MCAQRKFRSACASAQSDQILRYSFEDALQADLSIRRARIYIVGTVIPRIIFFSEYVPIYFNFQNIVVSFLASSSFFFF